MAKQYTNPAKQGRLNTSLEEEREVATRVLSGPTVYTIRGVLNASTSRMN